MYLSRSNHCYLKISGKTGCIKIELKFEELKNSLKAYLVSTDPVNQKENAWQKSQNDDVSKYII